jgi:hypothetical protein
MSGAWPPRPGAGGGRARARRSRPGLDPGAQFALLAAPAGFAGAHGSALPWPVRVAEFAEDLAQPVVHFRQDGGPVGEVGIRERGETGDGRIHSGITGGD